MVRVIYEIIGGQRMQGMDLLFFYTSETEKEFLLTSVSYDERNVASVVLKPLVHFKK